MSFFVIFVFPAFLSSGVGLITMMANAPLSDTDPGPESFAPLYRMGKQFVLAGAVMFMLALLGALAWLAA